MRVILLATQLDNNGWTDCESVFGRGSDIDNKYDHSSHTARQ